MNAAEIELKKSIQISNLISELQKLLKPYLNKIDTKSEIINKISNCSFASELDPKTIQNLIEFIQISEPTKLKFSEVTALKLFLKKMNWKIADSSFNDLDDSSIFEIYDHRGYQVYRSFNFFKISSYSIADILTNHWWDLYDRNPFIAKSLADRALAIFTQQIKEVVPLQLESHITTEKWSEQIGEAEMKHEYLIPLTDEDCNIVAILSPIKILNFYFKKPLAAVSVEIQ